MNDLTITTFAWVPEFPRGYVRDIRMHWALEEAGLPTLLLQIQHE
jgi:glutathione S-transferase